MSIGATEIIALAILALLVFGPQRLPDIARQVGRAIAEVRKVSREFEREVKDLTDPFASEIRKAEREARQTYRVAKDFSGFEADPAKETPPPPEVEQDGPAPEPD